MKNYKCCKKPEYDHETLYENVTNEKEGLAESGCSSAEVGDGVGADEDKIGTCTDELYMTDAIAGGAYALGTQRKCFESESDEEKLRQQQVENKTEFRRLPSPFPLAKCAHFAPAAATTPTAIQVTDSLIDDLVFNANAKTDCTCSCQRESDGTKRKECLNSVVVSSVDISISDKMKLLESQNNWILAANRCWDLGMKDDTDRMKQKQHINFQGRKNDDSTTVLDTHACTNTTNNNNDMISMLLKNTAIEEHIEFHKKSGILPITHCKQRSPIADHTKGCTEVETSSERAVYSKFADSAGDKSVQIGIGNECRFSDEIQEWISCGAWMQSKTETESVNEVLPLLCRSNCGCCRRTCCEEKSKDKSKDGCCVNCCGDGDQTQINTIELPTSNDEKWKNPNQRMITKCPRSPRNIDEIKSGTENPKPVPKPIQGSRIGFKNENVEEDETPPVEFSIDEMSEDDGEIPGPSHHVVSSHTYSDADQKNCELCHGGNSCSSNSSIYHAAHTESLLSNSSSDRNRQQDNNVLLSSSVTTVSGVDTDRQPTLEQDLMKSKGMKAWLKVKNDFDGDPLDFDEGSTEAIQMEVLWANRRFIKNDEGKLPEIIIPRELGQQENDLSNLSLSGEDSPCDNTEMVLKMNNKRRKHPRSRNRCDRNADADKEKREKAQRLQLLCQSTLSDVACQDEDHDQDQLVLVARTHNSIFIDSDENEAGATEESLSDESSCNLSSHEGISEESFALSLDSSTGQISYEASMSEAGDSIYDVEYMGRWDIFWPLMTKSERHMVGAPSTLDIELVNTSSRGFIVQPDESHMTELCKNDNDGDGEQTLAQRPIVAIAQVEQECDENGFHASLYVEPEVAEEAAETTLELYCKDVRIRRGPGHGHSSGGDTYAKLESCQVLYVIR